MCSHDLFPRTNKESSSWHQNDHAKFVGAFHLSRRVSDENRACSVFIRFFRIKDSFDGRSFLMCSHDPFLGTNKNRILKNGSCERTLRRSLSSLKISNVTLHVLKFAGSYNCAGFYSSVRGRGRNYKIFSQHLDYTVNTESFEGYM